MAEQNWATVLLEVIVVIVGIFLGLQATEWHEDRQARAEGLYYLDLLRRQMDAEIQMREEDLAEIAERNDLLRSAYELLHAESWSDDEYAQFKSDHFVVYWQEGESMRPSALRRLLDGGKIDLIRSRPMQEMLFALDRAYEEAIRQSESTDRRNSEAVTVLAIPVEPGVLLQSDRLRWAVRSILIMNGIQKHALETLQDARISARDELAIYLASQTSFDARQR